MLFSYESEASLFHLIITRDDGTERVNTITSYKRARVALEPGAYTMWVRPVDSDHNYIAPAAEITFTFPIVSKLEDIVPSNGTLYLYDLMGRLVDSKSANDDRPFNVPQSGIYILNREKVFIRL